MPVGKFFGQEPPLWPLTMTSISENKLLRALGLSHAERCQIEGLQMASSLGGRTGLTEEQLSSSAIVRLAANPPPEVGVVQCRTAHWLLRYAART
jgi:hypothetical protein|eukprot:2097935-Prymnesium_polylepis.1